MSSDEIYSNLRDAVIGYDPELAKKAAKDAVASNLPLLKAVSALMEAIREVGLKFGRFECFLPHLMQATDAMNAGLEVILPRIPKEKIQKVGTVLIGTVKGDVHDIGKKIVISMLTAEGFDIQDLGIDVAPSKFAEEAEKHNPDIVAASALMSTTKPVMAELIEYFTAVGIRDKYKIMIGGAPVTQQYANDIGADGYAPDAVEAAKLARKLVKS